MSRLNPSHRARFVVVLSALIALSTAPGIPQEPTPEQPDPFAGIEWQTGPATVSLGDIAQIQLPEGFSFSGKEGTRKFLIATENPPSGEELGVILPAAGSEQQFWFAIFEFKDVGYVKDDERDKLDADALLTTLREGTEHGNRLRKERGWSPISLTGWEKPPFYDTKTQNLTWALHLKSDDGESVNYSTRLLGRGGYMTVDLVLSPGALDSALPQFEKVLGGFGYVEGQRYAEFKPGDKIAEYGLAALVAGGVGAALVKTGLLQKFWKLIVAAVIGGAAAARRLFARLFSGGEMKMPPQTPGDAAHRG